MRRLVQKPLIQKTLVKKRLVEKTLVEKPLVEKPLVEKTLVEKPLFEKTHSEDSRSEAHSILASDSKLINKNITELLCFISATFQMPTRDFKIEKGNTIKKGKQVTVETLE